MEIFLGIIIVVLLISLRVTILKRIAIIEKKVDRLSNQNISKSKAPEVVAKSEPVKQVIKQPDPTPIVPKPIEVPKPVESKPVLNIEVPTEAPKKKKVENIKPVKKPKRSFEAWEKFIGENLLNKIGIAILVLGIGYFVKFAIDKDWIGEIGRVAIGVLCGGILLGIAHKLRNSFRAFSSVLTGGGIVVLYFTVAIGYMWYDIFDPTAAFLLMIVITAFGAVLSIAYDKVELAVIALLGGLASPILVSTGEGNYKVLFLYLIILNGGMLLVAFKKQWKLINLLALIGTVVMIGGWLFKLPETQSYNPILALVFGSALFLEFFLMNVLRNLKLKVAFKAFDFSLLLSNTALFYSFGMIVLSEYHEGVLKGLFTISLAVFNFMFAFYLKKKSDVDKNFIYLLIGLVLTLGSLAAPIQLDGNLITLFWAAEMCLLLWMYQKSGLQLVKLASVVVFGATLISLFMDWNSFYANDIMMNPFTNKALVTGLFVTASMVFYRYLLKKETNDFFSVAILETRQVVGALSLVIGFVVGVFELNYSLSKYYTTIVLQDVWMALYVLAFVVAVVAYIRRKENDNAQLIVLPISVFVIGLYIFNYQGSYKMVRHLTFAENNDFNLVYNMHYITTIVFSVLLYKVFKMVELNDNLKSIFGRFLRPFTAIVVLIIISQELNHICIQMFGSAENYYDVIAQTEKAGYALTWGILAMIFMVIGIKKKNKSWRLISLALLTLTLLKLFIYDIRGISEGGKIAAFIGLGILLLIVSFMYQKVKDLILNDEQND